MIHLERLFISGSYTFPTRASSVYFFVLFVSEFWCGFIAQISVNFYIYLEFLYGIHFVFEVMLIL